MLTSGFSGAAHTETIDGYKVVRVGGRVSVYIKAWRYYQAQLRGWADLVIDECNTLPFMTKFYVRERRIMFFHMLCREIWFYQLPKYIGWVGYIIEPIYLRLLSSEKIVTVSNSTKIDLIKHGLKNENISVISEGIELNPVADLSAVQKFEEPTLLSLGSVRAMKRTLDQVKAFEIAKETLPTLKLIIAGDYSDKYGLSVKHYVESSRFTNDISMIGRISEVHKTELLQKAHLLLVTSIKEGWGLVVTEANSQGTPAVVYDVDGLRDSVRDNETGIVTRATPLALAESITELMNNEEIYGKIRVAGHAWSMQITFNRAYEDFKHATKI